MVHMLVWDKSRHNVLTPSPSKMAAQHEWKFKVGYYKTPELNNTPKQQKLTGYETPKIPHLK